jgi:hypothetical protein
MEQKECLAETMEKEGSEGNKTREAQGQISPMKERRNNTCD